MYQYKYLSIFSISTLENKKEAGEVVGSPEKSEIARGAEEVDRERIVRMCCLTFSRLDVSIVHKKYNFKDFFNA